MPDKRNFADLALRVGAFHITDRAMKQAQQRVESDLATGDVDSSLRQKYLASVRRYFDAFSKEARAHLRDVDQRLEHVNQVHFNLNAERGVAVKRIEATEAILRAVDEVEDEAASR
jgi:hypothetical protein